MTSTALEPLSDVPAERAPRLLLVEDDAAMCEFLAMVFEEVGYRVLALASAVHTIDAIRSAAWPELDDLSGLVTDYRMHGASGLDLVRALRSEGCQMPVVILSAFADPTLVHEAALLRVSRVIDKPFALDALLGVLNQLVPVAARTK